MQRRVAEQSAAVATEIAIHGCKNRVADTATTSLPSEKEITIIKDEIILGRIKLTFTSSMHLDSTALKMLKARMLEASDTTEELFALLSSSTVRAESVGCSIYK
jgi:hypothetical protein